MSEERLNKLLEAADEMETYLQSRLDGYQAHGINHPDDYSEEAEHCLLRLIEAMQAVVQLLQADRQEAGAAHV